MEKKELLQCLQKNGIPQSSFFVDGNIKDDAYGIVYDNGAFHVSYCERGELRLLKKFSIEEDANDFLYNELMRAFRKNNTTIDLKTIFIRHKK